MKKKIDWVKHNNPKELLLRSIHHFRKIMCSTEYTLEQKDRWFNNLLTDYLRCNHDDNILSFFKVTCHEWEIRRAYGVLNK